MKNIIKLLGLVMCSLFTYQASAQTPIEDQNPNYRVSMEKYMILKDSLLVNLGETVHNTYKAYDWYEAKQERKALRRQYRHEERMARAKYGRTYYSDYGYNYNYGYNNYYRNYSNWNWFPRIGFKTGNWWFSI
ncbi:MULTISPECIES: hypothetical protein [unclassified Myroides]|uniref:hypothetical protein n=1 Tax=unclassified Myroides TaxID=2642485 RepID=UPI0015FB29AA|nr:MULTISPECIES: hypothetical protein [unclassified Myroides]MBB1148629.1 hypothetical protein [Myroides sp. NP-2]MDM1406340.1 hypothetical protein [Myroides sp. DF42-4-2]